MNNVLDEINDLKNEPTRRAALRISFLLENNRVFFLKKIDSDFYGFILKQFEHLANESTLINTPAFKEEYRKLYGMLSYQLDKII
jgi:hypothetical protein